MKSKLRWLLLIIPLALFAWAYQVASWRPKLIGVQPGIDKVLNGNSKDRLFLSPDGKRMVSYWEHYSNGYQVSSAVWDVSARRMLWKQQRSEGVVLQPLAFSPDGRVLAGTQFGLFGVGAFPIVLCNAATGQKIREIRVNSLEPPFPYESKTGNPLAIFGAQSGIQSVAFLSNRQLVVSNPQGALVADTQTGKILRKWKFELPVLDIALGSQQLPQSYVSTDGKTVVALGNGMSANKGISGPNSTHHDQTVVAIYDAKNAKQRAIWTFKGVFRNPRLSPDGTLWAMDPENSDVPNFYDARTGKELWSPSHIISASSPWIWSADSKQIVCSVGSNTWLFDARTGQYLSQAGTNSLGTALALDPRGDFLYTLNDEGKIYRWRLR